MEKIHGLIRPDNFAKTCVYLLRMSNYLADTEEQMKMLKVVFDVYLKVWYHIRNDNWCSSLICSAAHCLMHFVWQSR